MFLTLHSGQQVQFADVELAQILIRLQAQNQSYCLGEHDTAQIRVGGGLLVVDVAWTVGRRLVEGYQIGSDSTFPFGIKFTLGQAVHTLYQALAGSGYVGFQQPTLAQVYMGLFTLESAGNYVEPGQLVQDGGVVEVSPAKLKTLVAGSNVQLVVDDATVTLSSTSDVTTATVAAALAPLSTEIEALQATVSTLQPGIASFLTQPGCEDFFVNDLFPHFKSLSATLPLSLSSDALNVNIALDSTGFATAATSYTKDQVNSALLQKADASTVFSKTEVTAALLTKQVAITASAPLALTTAGALSITTAGFAPASTT